MDAFCFTPAALSPLVPFFWTLLVFVVEEGKEGLEGTVQGDARQKRRLVKGGKPAVGRGVKVSGACSVSCLAGRPRFGVPRRWRPDPTLPWRGLPV